MKQLLLLVLMSCLLLSVSAQKDSVTARYLATMVERIESNLEEAVELSTDTTIIDNEGTMTVHTSYYFDRGSGEIQKVKERTLFGTVTTEIEVYYKARSPILFSSKQWQASQLKIDFDYYFQTGSPVYLVKRVPGKKNPNSDDILKWCNQFLNESQNKKLVKINEDSKLGKKITEPKQKPVSTKKPLLPFFKKKKN